MDLKDRVEEQFGLRAGPGGQLAETLRRCAGAYRGEPDWLDGEAGIGTVNYAKAVCSEAARLTCLAVRIGLSGGERARWLQKQVDKVYFKLRHWVELGCARGTVIFKAREDGIDLVEPDRFVITDFEGGQVTGAVFEDRAYDRERDRYYIRLEHHRFLPDGRYAVSNRCTEGASFFDRGKVVPVEATPWAGLAEETLVQGLERPLFGVFRTPEANNIDPASPLGLPLFAGALREMRDLDVAYSRNAGEIYDSQRISLVDERLTEQTGAPLGRRREMKLPRFVRRVFGAGPEEYYREIDPALHTQERLAGINALLGQIGYKCGFSNGYFVFDQRSGLMTATQVEADDRRTVQLVKDLRDKLEDALEGVIYGLDAFAQAGRVTPPGTYEAVFDFGDVTYNREEDRARWYGYVADGRAPFWYYLTKFEGYSPEEAKALAGEGGSGK